MSKYYAILHAEKIEYSIYLSLIPVLLSITLYSVKSDEVAILQLSITIKRKNKYLTKKGINTMKKKIEYNELEKIFIPNEIFKDLKENIKPTVHVAFAYCYYYLISYLYRYCKYVDNSNELLSQKDIKVLLGYSKDYKVVDYLTKKGGVLDVIGYTQTTGNYPIIWELIDKSELVFYTSQDLKESNGASFPINNRNFKIKYPMKAFHRNAEGFNSRFKDGTFFTVENTHMIMPSAFMKAMENKKIGCIGFYLYGFFKQKSESYGNERYDATWPRLIKETGLSSATLNRYIKILEKADYIKVKRHTKYQTNYSGGLFANSYSVNNFLKPVKIKKALN